MLVEFTDSESGFSVVFEDDGKAAYGYLRLGEDIVADEWLYNHGHPPREPRWNDPAMTPLANPVGFASEERFEPITDPNQVQVRWAGPGVADIYLRGTLHAKLEPGAKPGWSRLALKDGPLAKVLR